MKGNFDLTNIVTPVRHEVFQQFLTGYDELEKQFIVTGFAEGFRMGFQGPRNRVVETDNLPSCLTYPGIVWEKIQKEVEAGTVAGPYSAPPFKHYIQSPIGLVPKAGQQGKFRLIFHLSAPDPEHSLNGQTPHHLCTVKYKELQDAVQLMQEIGPDARIGKSDMEHVFRQVPIHPRD